MKKIQKKKYVYTFYHAFLEVCKSILRRQRRWTTSLVAIEGKNNISTYLGELFIKSLNKRKFHFMPIHTYWC